MIRLLICAVLICGLLTACAGQAHNQELTTIRLSEVAK